MNELVSTFETARVRAPWRTALWLRRFHIWSGAFFAPAILFFAISGVFQVFQLHKAQPTVGYQPPPLIIALDELHKHQSLRAPKEPAGAPRPKPRATDGGDTPSAMPAREPTGSSLAQQMLKAYVTLLSVALVVSTLAGLTLSLRNRRERPLVLASIVAGTVLPVSLVFI